MHSWPIVHSADVTQSWAPAIAIVEVSGGQCPPDATVWQEVFACMTPPLFVASPQQTWPEVVQSIAPRHPNPA